jgi:uncharacterized protein (UPF0147 family)
MPTRKEEETSKEIGEIAQLMDNIIEDNTIPKNIRKNVTVAKEKVTTADGNDHMVALSAAIYKLEELMGDINLPFHTRTDVLSIISELERLKEELKEQ